MELAPIPTSPKVLMNVLFIVNDQPYGSERALNALRLADAMVASEPELKLTLFLLGDAVACAKTGQVTPQGYFNFERALKPILRKGLVLACETCLAARGFVLADLVEGCRPARLGDLASLTLDADKVVVF